jgi:hypothetical protein
MKSLRKQGIIIFSILALVLVLVVVTLLKKRSVEETTPEVVETLDSPAVTTAQSVKTGVGVTSEACPADTQLLEHSYRCRPRLKDVFI